MPLQVPDHPLANSQNIRDVATCGLDGATLVFESGIQVQVDRSEITDPAKYFALLVSDEPARTTVGEMKGRVAAFDDPDALGGDRGKMGFVWFVLDGWNVVVKGLGNASLAELKEIAESLHPYQAPSGETS